MQDVEDNGTVPTRAGERPQAEEQPRAGEQPQAEEQRRAGEQPQAEEQHQVEVPQAAEQPQAGRQETITYRTPDGAQIQVPVVRASMPDLFVALKPPRALPYIMASRDADPQKIVQFFAEHVEQVEELRADMLKRFAKSDSLKCRYQTGDVAYVMGRPFQLRVYPLGSTKERPKSGMRGRTTSKFTVDYAVSLLTLYVMHPRRYDEARNAFKGYAERVISHNATTITRDLSAILMPGQEAPAVRLRAMRDRWSSHEAGALWISNDLVAYPPDCLVYVLWKELERNATISPEEVRERFERTLPGWRRAREILATREQPYSLQ